MKRERMRVCVCVCERGRKREIVFWRVKFENELGEEGKNHLLSTEECIRVLNLMCDIPEDRQNE